MESVEYKIIPLNKISPGKFQFREDMEEELTELSDSIDEYGMLQAILVTPMKDKVYEYEAIYGRRRYFASILKKKETIPCFTKKNISEEDKFKLALIENSQRKQLNPIEEARMYKQMLEELKITQEELGKLAGKNRPVVAHTLRLLNLPKEIQASVSRDTISPGHARALLRIESTKLQLKLYHLIVTQDLSVRQTEEWVENMMKLKTKKKEGDEIPQPEPKTMAYGVAQYLSARTGTEVNVREFKKKRKLEITFGSDEDLIKIINRFSQLKISDSDIKKIKKSYEEKVSDALDAQKF